MLIATYLKHYYIFFSYIIFILIILQMMTYLCYCVYKVLDEFAPLFTFNYLATIDKTISHLKKYLDLLEI